MNNGIILMAGLPIHEGHIQFVRWASNFSIGKLTVLVCGRESDPVSVQHRAWALREAFLNRNWDDTTTINIVSVTHEYPDYPEQFDGTVEEFDQIWVKEIKKHVDFDSDDILFASDSYGKRFADNLGVKFAPYDPNRETIKISGTKIRRDPFNNFKYISPYLQRLFRQKITIFGAESTGKTTMAKKMAEKYNSPYVPEWARPYLESLETPEVTDERMSMIVRGQLASQRTVRSVEGNPFIFQDTDLFSTVGYYNIYGGGSEIERGECFEFALNNASDLYIVMNSNIKFSPDPLRYGITKRESTDKFWINLLEENDCQYYYVKSTNPIAQEEEVSAVVEKFFYDANPVFGFERV